MGLAERPDGLTAAQGYLGHARASVTPAVGSGTFTVASSRFVAEPPYAASRAFIRKVSPK